MSNSISVAGYEVTADLLPSLLSDLGLLHVFVRRLLIRKHTADILPDRDAQINFQKVFFLINNISDQQQLSSWLLSNDLSESEMSLHLYRSLQLEILKKNLFSAKVQSYFLANKEQFDMFSYSLIRSSSRSKINELYIRLSEDEDTFSSLSSQFSEGPESDSNGFISLRPLKSIHPEIAERLRISRPGQLWQPFQIANSWILIRLEKVVHSSLDEKTSSSILSKLFDSWLDDQVMTVIDDLESSELFDSSNIIDYHHLLADNITSI